jgi:type I restriction enzyme S subunit
MMGELPEGWSLARLGEVASDEANSFVDGPFGSDLKVSDYTETGVRILQLQNLGDGEFVNKNKIYTSEAKARLIARCITKPGDIIIAKMAEPLARAVVVPPVEEKFLIVADLMKLRVSATNDPIFVKNAINAPVFRREAERLSTGTTRTRISLSVLKKIGLPSPSFQEQRRIAKILSTVDNLIEKTQALIDKYQSIKQGMMYDLFTRGVDQNGQLRPSYEEASHLYKESDLGWIPKEWKVASLGTVSDKIQDGTHFSPQTTDGECLYVTSKNIRFGYMDLSHCERISKSEHEQIYRRCDVKKGDILLTKDGANTGNAAINTVVEEFSLLSSVAFIRAADNVSDANYIAQYLLSPVGQNKLKDLMSGNAITRLTLTKIKAFMVAFAPYKEQVCIGKMLSSFNMKVSREKECLEKYKTIKSGLMQDLLTGKVRVKVDDEVKS